MGMVFQSWALFPNMTAAENIGFPLRLRGLPPTERARRVAEIVALVGLDGLERRYPHELSGGQQQRVGIGRALARDPRVLLLDEPLSALDAPVRRGLIVEIRRLQQALRMTALYVTHDQEEALGMSDRVAVMDRGRIVEVGTPERLYRAPASPFAARFLGAANLLEGVVEPGGVVRVGAIALPVAGLASARPGGRVQVSLRPEELALHRRPPTRDTAIPGRVLVRTFMGAVTRFEIAAADLRWRVDVPSGEADGIGGGQEVWLTVAAPGRVVEAPVDGPA
jgi:ABC-type Fe3+/spermidine/putrescine transport system ATPase subunit